MNICNKLSASLLALAAGISFQASAAETTSTFQSTASVASSCAILGAANLNFSTYSFVNNARGAGPSAIQVRCNGGTAAIVQVDSGLNPNAVSTCEVPLRQMKSAEGELLEYTLYKAPSFVPRDYLGCGATTQVGLSYDALATKVVNVYGSITAGQGVKSGSYVDTVTVKVLF